MASIGNVTSPSDPPDPRLIKYRQFVEAVGQGYIDPKLTGREHPTGPEDEVAKLGDSLMSMALTLSNRFEQERQFAEVSREIVQGLYLDEVLQYIYESFHPLIPYDRIGCALLEKNSTVARSRWVRSNDKRVLLKGAFSAPMKGSSLQTIIDTGHPRIINDLTEYGEQHPQSLPTKLMLAEGIRSSLTCPLIAMGRPVGFLFFSSTQVGCYETIHQDVFLHLADMVSIVVEKSLLYEEMSQLNQELTEARALLELQATHDGLTGLLNHAAIIQELTDRTREASFSGKPGAPGLGAIMVDIDHFKSVNDTYGHTVGDQVLRAIAGRISSNTRATDRIGRYGGEEFLVVIEVDEGDSPLAIAERLRSAVEDGPVTVDSGEIHATISVGVAVREPGAEESAWSLISRADQALYEAKRSGRNRVVVD